MKGARIARPTFISPAVEAHRDGENFGKRSEEEGQPKSLSEMNFWNEESTTEK
ncbi:MAG TPA: hypothetical protein VJT08_04240 [Terriglobales bacterium]|nr:hypothetical protein [Terriglobales bacterium]